MIQKFTIAIMLPVLTSITFGQTKNKSDKQGSADEQTIAKLEQKMAEALMKGDSSFIENCLKDSFVFLSPFGNLLNKNQVIDDVKSGSLQMQSLKIEDIKVRVNVKTAIVTYRTTNQGVFKFVDISGRYRWIDVFENFNGNWKLIYQQGRPVN
jgi:hypothetical protein